MERWGGTASSSLFNTRVLELSHTKGIKLATQFPVNVSSAPGWRINKRGEYSAEIMRRATVRFFEERLAGSCGKDNVVVMGGTA